MSLKLKDFLYYQSSNLGYLKIEEMLDSDRNSGKYSFALLVSKLKMLQECSQLSLKEKQVNREEIQQV